MRLTKKRGVIALLGAVAVAAAVAIPTVLASSSASREPVSTATRPVVGPATTTTGSCGHSRTAIATDDYGLQSTASTSFVPVTGMSVDFTTASHCAEITFSYEAAVNPDSDDLMYVRVVVDGTVCLPGDVQWMSDHPDLNVPRGDAATRSSASSATATTVTTTPQSCIGATRDPARTASGRRWSFATARA